MSSIEEQLMEALGSPVELVNPAGVQVRLRKKRALVGVTPVPF